MSVASHKRLDDFRLTLPSQMTIKLSKIHKATAGRKGWVASQREQKLCASLQPWSVLHSWCPRRRSKQRKTGYRGKWAGVQFQGDWDEQTLWSVLESTQIGSVKRSFRNLREAPLRSDWRVWCIAQRARLPVGQCRCARTELWAE